MIHHMTPARQRISLWDLPTRLFHWLLLLAVGTAIASGSVGGNWMELHGRAGLAIVALLVFRLVWGFVGNHYARFASFFPLPWRLRSYLGGRWRGLGHNPLGALSVLALLGVLTLQVSSGLVSNDEIAFTGPLSSLVSETVSLRLTGLHHQLSKVLFVLLGLHVAAIFFHLWIKKDNLIRPMVTGFKTIEEGLEIVESRSARWPALVTALLTSASAVYLASGRLLSS
jgi:cytochrome b